MKCKYKKFLKAAYIDYEEDYCSNAVLRKTRPPLEEILAPATFEVTLNYADGYYWATFYTSMANYLAPDGVRVYKVNLNGSQFTSINIEDGIINKRQGVVLRSSTSSVTLTKTYSKSSDDYSNNSLIGTDYLITNPGNAYGLNYKQSHGLSFYPLSSTGKIKANAAYLIMIFTYLTQWKIVGNSQVHTDEYLTQWKVSGNSVVDNNTILSCGDLGQDGKYHVKISNGVAIFDIPLDAPLRKVNGVADTIEFPSTDGKALVTRNVSNVDLGDCTWVHRTDISQGVFTTTNLTDRKKEANPSMMCEVYTRWTSRTSVGDASEAATLDNYNYVPYYLESSFAGFTIYFRNTDYADAYDFAQAVSGLHLLYQLATPTTELVDISPFAVSPTDTYTAANVVPYSAFEHTENKEIWSCGEYNATDGKYHILVQPQGGSIADIALTEPLRKVNDVVDTIEFPSNMEGKALVTRNLKSADLGDLDWIHRNDVGSGIFAVELLDRAFKKDTQVLIPSPYTFIGSVLTIADFKRNAENMDTALFYTINPTYSSIRFFYIYNKNYNNANDFKLAVTGIHMIYELATPITELVDAPQIEEAESYSCVISQGGKAVSWSSFETE